MTTTRTTTTTEPSAGLHPRPRPGAGFRAGLRRVGAAFGVATILFAAGCAGDDGQLSKSEYSEAVRSLYADVQEAFAATDAPPEELAERVVDAQAALREAADELDDLAPPEDAVAANAQIAEGFRLYADELDRLRNAAERGDQPTIDDFNARAAQRESVRQIAEAAESLKFSGYDLGQIADE